MSRERFLQRKTAVLSKLDKSSIGKWDKRVVKLCNSINRLQDFYTTSSCSGRVILMIQQDKKGKDLFLKTWHENISFSELKKELGKFISKKQTIKFKLEPPIIHIACRDLKKASEMMEKAKYIGFKRSSILTCERNIFLELNTSERLEFPVINKGEIIVSDEYLKLIVKISNEKMGKWWEKIKKLEDVF